MKKRYIISIILIAILGFLIGLYVYKTNKFENIKIADDNFSVVTDECTKIAEKHELGMIKTKETNSSNEVISPNASIILKTYYKHCKHTIITKENNIKELVNLSQEELQEKYTDWSIEKFSPQEVVLYKEIEDFCNEHYILRENNGYIAIYTIDEEENIKLFRNTDIATNYLAEDDLRKIKGEIRIDTKKELNKLLEDYE